MTKDIFIFRHGQTDFNLKHICQGCMTDLPLNDIGITQADDLGHRLSEHIKLEAIYTSPLKRAFQTALIVRSHYPNTPLRILPELREGNFGIAEGKNLNDLDPKLVADFLNPTKQTWTCKFPGKESESKQQIFKRALLGLQKIAAAPETSVGVSTHAGIISALVCGLRLKDIKNDNCCVLHLRCAVSTGKIFQAE